MEIVNSVTHIFCVVASIAYAASAILTAKNGSYDRAAYYMAFAAWLGSN